MKRNAIRQRGFTLIEALASSVALCAAVALIGAISGKTMKQIRANRDTMQAWQILDEQMTLVTQMGLSSFLALGQNSGEVEHMSDNGETQVYQWQARIQENSVQAGLFELTMGLGWDWQGKSRMIQMTTMVYDASLSSAMLDSVMGGDEEEGSEMEGEVISEEAGGI